MKAPLIFEELYFIHSSNNSYINFILFILEQIAMRPDPFLYQPVMKQNETHKHLDTINHLTNLTFFMSWRRHFLLIYLEKEDMYKCNCTSDAVMQSPLIITITV